MATDVLILGPFIFTDFAVPDHMPFGGEQKLEVHRYPGGGRDVDAMGPDDSNRTWKGILWGDDAMDTMALLDAMRSAGEELMLIWGAEARNVVISDCHFEVQKVTCIHYSITVVFSDDSGSSFGGFATVTDLVGADLGLAVGL